MAGKKNVTVEVSPNTSLIDADGVLRRAGDRFDVANDDTVRQWLGAGWVTKVSAVRSQAMAAPKPRRKARTRA